MMDIMRNDNKLKIISRSSVYGLFSLYTKNLL